MVIIAIGDLHKDNGLPVLANVHRLESGESLVLDGGDDIIFSGKGGDLALLLVIEK